MYTADVNKSYLWLCVYELCIFLSGVAASLFIKDENLIMLVAVAVSLLIVVLCIRPMIPELKLFVPEKKMGLNPFLLCLSALCLVQLFATGISELGKIDSLGLFGNAKDTGESAMIWYILYVGILGPVAEEFLFRGVLLGTLKKYGKISAILISAFSFALIHGSIGAAVAAFPAGILFGYIALNYSVVYSLVFHLLSNLMFAVLPKILTAIGILQDPTILLIFLIAFSLPLLILLIVKRKEVSEKWKQVKAETVQGSVKSIFRGMWFILFNGLLILSMILSRFVPILN